MTCLDEILCGERTIIAIKDFDACKNPESKLFINDLPGISLKSASSIASEQYQSGFNLLNHSINMAVRHVYDEMKEQIKPYFDMNSIVETKAFDVFNDTVIPAANLDRGLVVKRWRSEMAHIYIHELVFKTQFSGNITITLTDGCDTETYTHTVVANCITKLRLDYKAKTEEVKITFNQNAIGVYSCSMYNDMGYNDCRCGSWSSKGLYVTGWNGTAEQARCFGMGVVASVKCDFESLFCMLLDQLYFTIWYKAGIVFLKELINSDRINAITLFTKERAKVTLEEWEAEYKKKFETAIKNARMFMMSTKGECISCNGTKLTQQLP